MNFMLLYIFLAFLLFFIIKLVFFHSISFFWWSIKFPWQNFDQSERGISGSNLSLELSEAVAQRRSAKKVFLEISQNSQETPAPKVLSCEFCEISINTFIAEHLRWPLLNCMVLLRSTRLLSHRTENFLVSCDIYCCHSMKSVQNAVTW